MSDTEKKVSIRFGVQGQDQATKAFKDVSHQANEMAREIATGSEVTEVLGSSFMRMAMRVAPVAAAIAAVGKAVKDTAERGEMLERLSQKTGITVENLSGLQYAAKMTDVEFGALQKGLKFFERSLGGINDEGSETRKMLKELGVTAKDPMDAFRQLADGIASIEDPTTRTNVVMKLLGKSGNELIPMLLEGSAGLKRFYEEAEKAGRIMSTDAAKAAATFRDNLKQLEENVSGLANRIGNALIPKLNNLFDLMSGKMGNYIKLDSLQSQQKELQERVNSSDFTLKMRFGFDWKKAKEQAKTELEKVNKDLQALADEFSKQYYGEGKKEPEKKEFKITDTAALKTAAETELTAEKERFSKRMQIIKQGYSDEMAEAQTAANVLKAIDEMQYGLGDTTVEQHYKARAQAIAVSAADEEAVLRESLSTQLTELTTHYQKTKEIYAKLAAATEKKPEREAVESKGTLELEAIAQQKVMLEKDTDSKVRAIAANAATQRMANDTQYYQRKRQLAVEEIQHEASMQKAAADDQMNAAMADLQNQKGFIDDLRSRRQISDQTYYAFMVGILQDEEKAQQDHEARMYEIARTSITDQMLLQKTTPEEQERLWHQLEQLATDHNGRMTEIARRGANQVAEASQIAAQDFSQGWADGLASFQRDMELSYSNATQMARDTATGLTAAFDDGFFGKFEEGMTKMKDTFKALLLQMVNAAITNPIIVPIVQSVKGMIGKPGTATTAGTGLTGLLETPLGIGNANVGTLGALSMLGLSAGGIGGAIGSGAGYLGGSAATMTVTNAVISALGGTVSEALGSALLSAVPIIGTVLGGVLGSFIGDLFGGKKRPPAMDLSYVGGQGPEHIGAGWQGASVQGQTGRWEVVGQHGIDTKALEPVTKAFAAATDAVKQVMDDFGMDVSGFSKVWHSYIGDLTGKSGEEVQQILRDNLNDALAFFAGPEIGQKIEAMQKNGEDFVAALDHILTSITRIKSVGTASAKNKDIWGTQSGWDMKKLFDEMGEPIDTFTEQMDTFKGGITDLVSTMNSSVDSPAKWREALDDLDAELVQAYGVMKQLIAQYRMIFDSIPAVFQEITNAVDQNIRDAAVSAQGLQILDPRIFAEYADAIDGAAEAAGNATPLVDRMIQAYDKWQQALDDNNIDAATSSLNEMKDAMMGLAQAAANMTNTALKLLEQFKTQGMSDASKVAYFNQKIKADWGEYEAAKKQWSTATDAAAKAAGAEKMTYWGGKYEGDVTSAGQITGAKPDPQILSNLATLATDGVQIQSDIRAATLEIPGILQGDILTAIGAVSTSVTSIAAAIKGINFSPIINVSVEAPAQEGAAASHALGLDYVPYDNYRAKLHEGEAVITKQGNQALADILKQLAKLMATQQQPVTVNVSGDMAPLIDIATENTVKVIRKDPSVIRR